MTQNGKMTNDDLIRRFEKFIWAFGWSDILTCLKHYEKLALFYTDLMGPTLGTPPAWWYREFYRRHGEDFFVRGGIEGISVSASIPVPIGPKVPLPGSPGWKSTARKTEPTVRIKR